MIEYTTSLKKVNKEQLEGFFIGWPNPPSKEVFLEILKKSHKAVLAIENKKVIGFITSISDGILSAYIPLFEVLPEYKGKGIGGELLSRLKNELSHLYMIDLICDEDVVSYYEKQGMNRVVGASIRNYKNQNGASL